MKPGAILFDSNLTLMHGAAAAGVCPRAYLAALAPAICRPVGGLAENVSAARSIGMRAYKSDRTLPGLTAGGRKSSLLDLIGMLTSPGAGPELRLHFPDSYDMQA